MAPRSVFANSPMIDPLTPIERRVYHFLLDYLATHTYQPSVREIARRFRIRSTKTVAEIIQSLAKKGFVERPDGRSRGVRLIGYSTIGRSQPIPLYASVNSVEPSLSDANRLRYITMDRALLPSDEAFFLQAPDDSMQSMGILTNDLLLVDPTARSSDGDIAAARVGSSMVVRIIDHRGATISLSLPRSVDGEAVGERVLGPQDDFAILGVVRGVLRAALRDGSGDEEGVPERSAEIVSD
ncbi:MAG: LexA repressor [Gemmatimonadaceae bacterium]|nr:LexA repressor [Gemmatimonadaceae bacterium]